MISKNNTVFAIGNEKYQFNCFLFNQCVDRYATTMKIKKSKLESSLADKLFVSSSAIHNWRFGSNGPSSLDLIKGAAQFLEVDYMDFLRKNKEVKEMKRLSTLQIESLKKIYDGIIDFLDDFEKTNGFTGTLWYEFERKGSKDPEDDIDDYARNKIEEVKKIFLKEYFYLHDTDVYEEINNYIEKDLYETFEGKLGYAFRLEAIPEGHPTTFDDYSKALKKINEIIEQYTDCKCELN